MNDDLSRLSLTELYDKLSDCTSRYSKSMLNGFSEKEFAELKSVIEEIQREIAKRKSNAQDNQNKGNNIFPNTLS